MREIFITLCLLLVIVGAQAQDGLFKKQESRQFYIESEVLPWLNEGINVKAGMLDEKRAFGVRYSTQQYGVEDIFEGAFTQLAPNASVEQTLSVAVEYHYSPLHNFYIGTWVGYEEWAIPLLITEAKVTNWMLVPQVGYRWVPLNNVFINVGYRAKLVFGENAEDSILNDEFSFKKIITTPTLGFGLKF